MFYKKRGNFARSSVVGGTGKIADKVMQTKTQKMTQKQRPPAKTTDPTPLAVPRWIKRKTLENGIVREVELANTLVASAVSLQIELKRNRFP